MKNIKIIHLEDDAMQRALVEKWVQLMGIGYKSFKCCEDFFKADISDATCFVLDWELPDGTGLEVLKKLKQEGDNRPVLFATLRDDENDIVMALESGADDYVTKPIRQHEFIARIKVILRRLNRLESKSEMTDYAPYVIDTESETIRLNNELISLTHKEYQLAIYFFTHINEIVSREDIMSYIWHQHNELNTRTIDTHISRIRQKLQFGEQTGWKLYSIYLHGYRLRKINDK